MYFYSLRIWPSSLARKGRVSSVAASFPTIKCWLASTTAGGYTRRIPTYYLSRTPPAVNTSWKEAFNFSSMSERKLKHNEDVQDVIWIITTLFTHSHRVYIYKCTGTWTCANTHQHTSTSFLLAWKNSCVLLKKVLILAAGVAKISCYLAKQFLKTSSLEFSQPWVFRPGWTQLTGKDCKIHLRHVYC